MYPPKERAAKLLAVGESIEDVAKTVKKDEQTVKLWLLDEEFCTLLRANAGGAALRILVGYLTGENEDKDRAMVALALLRMNKPPPSIGQRMHAAAERDGASRAGLPFTEEQLKRLEGDD